MIGTIVKKQVEIVNKNLDPFPASERSAFSGQLSAILLLIADR